MSMSASPGLNQWLDDNMDDLGSFLDDHDQAIPNSFGEEEDMSGYSDLKEASTAKVANRRKAAKKAKKNKEVVDKEDIVEKRKRRNTAEKQRIHKLRMEFEALVEILPAANTKMSRKDVIQEARREILSMRKQLGRRPGAVENAMAKKSRAVSPGDLQRELVESITFKWSGVPQAVANFAGIVLHANDSFIKVTGFNAVQIAAGGVGMFQMTTEEELAEMYLHAGELIRGDVSALCMKKSCKIADGKTAIFNVKMAIIRPPAPSKATAQSEPGCAGGSDCGPATSNGFFHCCIFPDGQTSL